MAGDTINAAVQYYYQSAVTNSTGSTGLVQDVLGSLADALVTSPAPTQIVHNSAAAIESQLGANDGFVTLAEPDVNNAGGNNPKAYLTVMFFDERFNYVGTGSASIRVSQAGDGAAPLVLAGIQAPKNGYAVIYISNESQEPVYFDNMQVGLNHARIIEEDHYYPFGLKIASISSQKLDVGIEGTLQNNYLYNDKELFDDGGLDWYEYGFRNYDPQIGRFPQLDPLTDYYPELAPYQYANNNPISNVDINGLFVGSILGSVANSSDKIAWSLSLASLVVKASPVTTSAKILKGFKTIEDLTSIFLHAALIAGNAINSNSATQAIGNGVQISTNELQKIFPNISKEILKNISSTLNKYMADFGITNEVELAQFLSQAGYETGYFKTLSVTEDLIYKTVKRVRHEFPNEFPRTMTYNEIKPYLNNAEKLANRAYANRNGNGNEASGDGYLYRGRGIMQLTGRDNYQAFTDFYQNNYDNTVDFVSDPDLIETEPKYSILSGLWYYKVNTASVKINDSEESIKAVTSAINGHGNSGLNGREALFAKAINVLVPLTELKGRIESSP